MKIGTQLNPNVTKKKVKKYKNPKQKYIENLEKMEKKADGLELK